MATPVKQKFALEGFQTGDIVGFSGKGWVADGINLGSFGIPRWGLSHIGIICAYRGKRYLFESTTLNKGKPCDIGGQAVSGVQAHYLDDILKRPGKVWRYKLHTPLNESDRGKLLLNLLSHLGTAYDYRGAARSGGVLLRYLEGKFRPEDLSTFFCSELVAQMLDKLGRVDINNVSAQSPNSLARRLLRDNVVHPRIRIK